MKFNYLIMGIATIVLLNYTKNKIMSKLDDINAILASINDSTNNIAADIDRISGGLSGGLTAADADSVIAQLNDLSTKHFVFTRYTRQPTTLNRDMQPQGRKPGKFPLSGKGMSKQASCNRSTENRANKQAYKTTATNTSQLRKRAK